MILVVFEQLRMFFSYVWTAFNWVMFEWRS